MNNETVATGLKRIALESGVSVMTASRALRGQHDVAAATRKKVLRVAERLRYRPNLLVRAIQTGKSGNIGVVIPAMGDFGAQMICGVHDELARRQYLPLLHWRRLPRPGLSDHDTETELDVIHSLLDRRVDGVILFPHDDLVPDVYFREVWQRHVPLVTVDRRLPLTRADFVGTDDRAGARMAADHLLSLGHRRVAHITGRARVGTFSDRRAGFESAIAGGGGRCTTVVIEDGDDAAAAHRVLRMRPRPTALFLGADNLAPILYRAAAAAGMQIPRDLSVVGFADLELASMMTPSLTTVRQDPYGIGREAARIVCERCNGKNRNPKPVEIRLDPQLITRTSTARLEQ
jgi:DNA-binding LacI/PurR family transcriptional regulator